MRHTLASLVLALFLFPSTAMGETVTMKDLVITNGLYYKKFTPGPFTGKVGGKSQGSIKKGLKTGLWYTYDRSSGRIETISSFKSGKLNGTVAKYRYYSNGQVKSQKSYMDSKKNGPFIEYHKNGQLGEKKTYKNGKKYGSWVGYWGNGQLKGELTYKDGKEQGPVVMYYENGQLMVKAAYKDGKKHGLGVGYHENGQLAAKGSFVEGERQGPWVIYDKYGIPDGVKSGTYKDGKKISD